MRRPRLGLGIGWRPELALDIERRQDLGFVEIIAENIHPSRIPLPLHVLRGRGVQVVPHGISLSLGGTEPLDKSTLRRWADLAKELNAPLVSEHIAFVRAGGVEAGHLLPLPRTRAALDVLIDNVRIARMRSLCRWHWKTSPPSLTGPIGKWTRRSLSDESSIKPARCCCGRGQRLG